MRTGLVARDSGVPIRLAISALAVASLGLLSTPTAGYAAFTIDQTGNEVTVHGDDSANIVHVFDAYAGGGPPYSVPTVSIGQAGGALESDQSPDCAGSYDAGTERLTITCSANVSLHIDLAGDNDALYLGIETENFEYVPEILGVEVSDGTGNDYVVTFMQLQRFGPGGVEKDLSLFDAEPLVINDGLGKDTFELATYPDPQNPGEETHATQRMDVSYAHRPDEGTPHLGPQLFVSAPGAPPSLSDPVTTTEGNGTYKNFQTKENDVFTGVFSVTGTQGNDLMFSDITGIYPAELHGAGGDDDLIDPNGNFLRAFGDDGNDLFHAGYPLESAPADWLSQDSAVGGAGVDTLTYQGVTELGVRINPGTNDNGSSKESNFVGTDIENFYGTPQPDQITATNEPNEIRPFEGSDVIKALGGDDEIYAEDSRRYRDKIDCGAGEDWTEFDYRALSLTKKVPVDSMVDCEMQEPAFDGSGGGCSALDEGVVYGADAFVLDSDEDGRTNCEEIDGIDGRVPTNPIVADTDSDSILDGPDNCPVHVNEDQADEDGDGVGDVCDAPAATNVTVVQNVSTGPVVNVASGVPTVTSDPGICALQRLQVKAKRSGRLEVRMRAMQARLVKIFVAKDGVRQQRWHRFRRRVERNKATKRIVSEDGVRALGMQPGKTYRLLVRVINEKPKCQTRYRRMFRLKVRIPPDKD